MLGLKFSALQMPYKFWLILIGTLLNSATYWMTWPFLSVILYQKYHLNPSLIGGILSLSVIFSTLFGIYFGHLSDRFGRTKMMIIGIITSTISYLFLAFSSSIALYLFAIGLVSLSRALVDPLSKAIFGDISQESSLRETALQIRYFTVNLGAACGPLIGTYFGLAAQQNTFCITALSFLVYLFFLYPLLKSTKATQKNSYSSSQNKIAFFNSIRILINDKAFMILVIINVLVWIVFIQFESTMALFFSFENVPNLAKIVSSMIFTNTITIIFLQFPLLILMKKISIFYRIYLSIFILSLSQLIFAFSPVNSYLPFITGTIIFSIAEVILVPNLNILIDQMARSDLRGSYFAVSFLYRLGSGAFIGGLLLQKIGGTGLFITMFFTCIIISSLYFYACKIYKQVPIRYPTI